MCVDAFACAPCACSVRRSQKRALGPPGLELKMVVDAILVLKTKPRSSGSALNH